MDAGATGEGKPDAHILVSGFWFLVCGADLADVIPELLRLADLEVRIPRLDILSLERLADRDGKSVDAVLARELLDVVSAHSEYLATAIPGFIVALRWPQ